MEFIEAKNIVYPTKNKYWFGTDYNMNIYRGCSHGCIYCDSRSDVYEISSFDTIRAKANALEIIREDLRSKRSKGVVATGSMSDPYNPMERKYKLTRGSLGLIAQYGFGIAVATKSDLVVRDIDQLLEIQKQAPVLVKITVTTPHDQLSQTIEPYVSTSSQRLAAITSLAREGIFVGVLMMPMLPWITDSEEDLRLLVRKSAHAGARFIYPSFGMTLRDGQREFFYSKLDQQFPGTRERYHQRYGLAYSCGVPEASNLQEVFAEECQRLGLLYRMEDIVQAYQGRYEAEQLQFF